MQIRRFKKYVNMHFLFQYPLGNAKDLLRKLSVIEKIYCRLFLFKILFILNL